jgi:hypothetical protein
LAVLIVTIAAIVIAPGGKDDGSPSAPPDTGDGTPSTEMVFTWQPESVSQSSGGSINGISNDVAVGAAGPAAATWVLGDGGWDGVTSHYQGAVNGITKFQGLLVGVGTSSASDDGDAAAWRISLDGTLVPLEVLASSKPGKQEIHKVVSSPDYGLIAVGEDDGDGAVWRSVDGQHWAELDAKGQLGGAGEQVMLRVQRFTPVTGGSEMLIAVGYEQKETDTDGAVWIAEEPGSWQRIPGTENQFGGEGEQKISDVIEGRDKQGLVAVGYAQSSGGDLDASVWLSDDGEHWTRSPSDAMGGPGDQIINRVIAPDPKKAPGLPMFIAAGSDDKDAALWYSDDGEHWVKQTNAGTSLGSVGDQVILALGIQPTGILALGYDKQSNEQGAAIWKGTCTDACDPLPV